MTADWVIFANFSNHSVKSLFVLPWNNWFPNQKKTFYTNLNKIIFLKKLIFCKNNERFFDILQYFVLGLTSFCSLSSERFSYRSGPYRCFRKTLISFRSLSGVLKILQHFYTLLNFNFIIYVHNVLFR